MIFPPVCASPENPVRILWESSRTCQSGDRHDNKKPLPPFPPPSPPLPPPKTFNWKTRFCWRLLNNVAGAPTPVIVWRLYLSKPLTHVMNPFLTLTLAATIITPSVANSTRQWAPPPLSTAPAALVQLWRWNAIMQDGDIHCPTSTQFATEGG